MQASWPEAMAQRDSLELHGLTPDATTEAVHRAYTASRNGEALSLVAGRDPAAATADALNPGAAPGTDQQPAAAAQAAAQSLKCHVQSLLAADLPDDQGSEDLRQVLQLLLQTLDSDCAGGKKLRSLISKLTGTQQSTATAERLLAGADELCSEPVHVTAASGKRILLAPCPRPEHYSTPASEVATESAAGMAELTIKQCMLGARAVASTAVQPDSGRSLAQVLALPADATVVARIQAAKSAQDKAAQAEAGTTENDGAVGNMQSTDAASAPLAGSNKVVAATGASAASPAAVQPMLLRSMEAEHSNGGTSMHIGKASEGGSSAPQVPKSAPLAATVHEALLQAAQTDDDLKVCSLASAFTARFAAQCLWLRMIML